MERYYLATLNAVSLIGSKTLQKLVEKFGSAENIWRAEISQLASAGFNQKIIDNLTDFRSKHPDAVEKLVEFCYKKNVKICTTSDENYPPILKQTSAEPIIFYYRGEIVPNAERIAIVGTREATPYGEQVTKILSADLAAAGLTIVSGAAKGIDTFAHQAALKNGRTVAVLGYGINKIPTEKRKFFEEIVAKGGVIMTEFPPNFDGNTGTFPARNRVIAGLSRGVIVVEAGERSGALITANRAADFSRDVFVVPHSIFSPKSAGCHNLIRDGAILIKGAEDVLEEYNFENKKIAPKIESEEKIVPAPKIELAGNEKIIYDAIPQGDFITLDEILNNVEEVSPAEISEIIVQLELKNLIFEEDGRYSKKF